MIIYKAVNKINNKCYIGQTIKSLKERKSCHLWEVNRNNTNVYFHNAIKKYGEKNFTWKVIEKCNTKEELDEMEFHYIKQYNSFKPNGYNLTLGGDKGTYGWIPSKETKLKISNGNKKWWSEKSNKFKKEWNKRLSVINSGENNLRYGIKRPEITGDLNPAKRPEVRQKISDKLKGIKKPYMIERNKKLSGKSYEERYGEVKANEIKKKKSISAKNSNVGKFKRSDETKEKMRLSKVKYLYEVTSPVGGNFVVNSLCKFAKDNKLNKASLFYHMKHNTDNHKGWKIKKI